VVHALNEGEITHVQTNADNLSTLLSAADNIKYLKVHPHMHTCTHTYTHTHTLSLSVFLFLSLHCFSVASFVLSITFDLVSENLRLFLLDSSTHWISLSLCTNPPFTIPLCTSLSFTRSWAHSLPLSISLSHTHTHTHSLSLSLSHTHTLTPLLHSPTPHSLTISPSHHLIGSLPLVSPRPPPPFHFFFPSM
jgi:hypothetical protein